MRSCSEHPGGWTAVAPTRCCPGCVSPCRRRTNWTWLWFDVELCHVSEMIMVTAVLKCMELWHSETSRFWSGASQLKAWNIVMACHLMCVIVWHCGVGLSHSVEWLTVITAVSVLCHDGYITVFLHCTVSFVGLSCSFIHLVCTLRMCVNLPICNVAFTL